jgi:hypothetical protein
MLLFLDDVPFTETLLEVEAPWSAVPVKLKPFQAVISVSLSHQHVEQLPPGAPRFPALVDTGNNHNLTIGPDHLLASGLNAPLLWGSQPLRLRDASGKEVEVHRLLVDVWIHSNRPELADQPYRVRLGVRGATCFPAAGPLTGPPLPLLGLSFFCTGSIALDLHCQPPGGVLKVSVPDMPWP